MVEEGGYVVVDAEASRDVHAEEAVTAYTVVSETESIVSPFKRIALEPEVAEVDHLIC